MLKKSSLALKERHFHRYAETFYHGFWHTFCDWHLEIVKVVMSKDSQCTNCETKDLQNITMWVLETFLHALHPIMPFITEAIWENMGFRDKRKTLLAQSISES